VAVFSTVASDSTAPAREAPETGEGTPSGLSLALVSLVASIPEQWTGANLVDGGDTEGAPPVLEDPHGAVGMLAGPDASHAVNGFIIGVDERLERFGTGIRERLFEARPGPTPDREGIDDEVLRDRPPSDDQVTRWQGDTATEARDPQDDRSRGARYAHAGSDNGGGTPGAQGGSASVQTGVGPALPGHEQDDPAQRAVVSAPRAVGGGNSPGAKRREGRARVVKAMSLLVSGQR
jgi:hypothetical protein